MRRASDWVHVGGTSVPDNFHRLYRFVTLADDVMSVHAGQRSEASNLPGQEKKRRENRIDWNCDSKDHWNYQ